MSEELEKKTRRITCRLKAESWENSLEVHWLGLSAFPGQGTKIPKTAKKKKKKKKGGKVGHQF